MDYPKNNDSIVMGVAWYARDQWKRLCDISEDKDQLENTYEEWENEAEKNIIILKGKGIHAEKVHIDINELLDWCIEKECPINGESRSAFAAYKIENKYDKCRRNRESCEEAHGFFDNAGNPVNDDLI